jgi:hypothetical protein
MVPVSWPAQNPSMRPRRSRSRCRLNTRASSITQELPAALSVAAGPNQESWCPPSTTKSSVRPGISPVVIQIGRHPFSTFVRNHTRTGPLFAISRSLKPSVRAMPMQGNTGISVP